MLDDKIEINSAPGPDRSVTQKDLRTYRVRSRRYRNRRIGDLLKNLRLTEGRNTGFNKILKALKKNGSPSPEFYTDEDRLTFSATIYVHPAFLNKQDETGLIKTEQAQNRLSKYQRTLSCSFVLNRVRGNKFKRISD